MLPLYFGPPSRRLFGAFHEGSPGRAQSLGVLLCNPFGQEAIRTHRLYRVLAGRLAQGGVHVLRFDYFGTGDSAGEDSAADLDSWQQDILIAQQELQRLCGATEFTWMGARLGAAAAISAAQKKPANMPHLVAWDPVVNGPAYAELMRHKHVEALEISYSLPDPHWRQQLQREPASFRDEAIGVAISPAMRRQLAALLEDTLAIPPSTDAVVIADPADRAVRAWAEAQRTAGARIEEMPLPQTLEWTSDDSLNAALVPAQAVQQLLLAIDR
jgi:pimeloyl-ACP methyl ester carboxylesterase